MSGLLRDDQAEETTGFRLPEGPYDTLGGLVMARLRRLPAPGDRASIDLEGGGRVEAEVLTVRRRVPEEVRLRTADLVTAGPGAGPSGSRDEVTSA